MINDSLDRAIIALLQGDLPLESRPFDKLARQLNITETEILTRIKKMQQKGLLRRWGAVLRHRQAGYLTNAMVAWKVEPAGADEAGGIMAGFQAVSHCYLRRVPDSFGYNMFTMIHAHNEPELLHLVGQVSQSTGIKDYIILKSLKEFKKASMKYV